MTLERLKALNQPNNKIRKKETVIFKSFKENRNKTDNRRKTKI